MIQTIKKHRFLIAGVILGLTLVYAISQKVVNDRLAVFKDDIEKDLVLAEKNTDTLVTLIARGGINEMAANIISDCPANERQEFDTKLGKLDSGLSLSDLVAVERLFSRCAPVFAIHRAIMVMQLRQEMVGYQNLVAQRKLLGDYTKHDSKLQILDNILDNEEKVSDLSFALVALQKEIISNLIAGVAVDSNEAYQLKLKGQSLQNELKIATESLATQRQDLLDI